MQQNHALKVALKDRPKIFQVIVILLFFSSLVTLIVSGFQSLEADKQPAASRRVTKEPHTHSVYASIATFHR